MQQYGLGREQELGALSEEDMAAAKMLGMSEADFARAMQANNAAGNWGDTAMNAYNKAYQQEAANSGWLKKGLAGAAGRQWTTSTR